MKSELHLIDIRRVALRKDVYFERAGIDSEQF